MFLFPKRFKGKSLDSQQTSIQKDPLEDLDEDDTHMSAIKIPKLTGRLLSN